MNMYIDRLLSKKWYVIVLILVIGAGWMMSRREEVSLFETTKVVNGNIVQEVSVTGKVEAGVDADLSFERSGKVVSTPLEVGARVKEGQVLARIDVSEQQAQLAQAEANFAYELAQLAELKRGARPEDVAISVSKVESATSALADAQRTLLDRFENAYTQSDDAIRNKVDVLLKNPRTRNPEINFPVTDAKLAISIAPSRVALEDMLLAWGSERNQNESLQDPLVRARSIEGRLEQVKEYLDLLALAVNSIVPSSEVSQTTIDAWKLSVITARTNVNTAITNLLAQDEKYRSLQSSLAISKNELLLKQAGATPESILAQEAKISAVRATIANYKTQIEKGILRAPFSGVITKQDAKLGQIVSPNVSIIRMIGDAAYQVVANVPEVDVAKISKGDKAMINLDAYGSDVTFLATVSLIDPAETVVEGVPTYKVTFQFDKEDERVRSGMTANIVVRTAEAQGVLMIPGRAVYTRDGDVPIKFVRIPTGVNTSKEVAVKTGLRGSNGMVVITEGLSEGDVVITAERSK